MNIFSEEQIKKVVVSAENHGYKSDVIIFKPGKPVQVKFILSDSMGCMNEIVFKDLGIDEVLDGKNEVVISIPTDKPSTHDLVCGTDMFHGKVVVK